jgi:ribonuclease E
MDAREPNQVPRKGGGDFGCDGEAAEEKTADGTRKGRKRRKASWARTEARAGGARDEGRKRRRERRRRGRGARKGMQGSRTAAARGSGTEDAGGRTAGRLDGATARRRDGATARRRDEEGGRGRPDNASQAETGGGDRRRVTRRNKEEEERLGETRGPRRRCSEGRKHKRED